MAQQSACTICLTGKAALQCSGCMCVVCKSCAQFLSPDEFHYADQKPQNLNGDIYCYNCHTSTVLPEIEKYRHILSKAEDVRIFDRTQTKETRLMKRAEKPLSVQKCSDPHEATLKLAYLAALKSFNALIEVDVKTIKIRNGSYQTSESSAIGIPTNISDVKIQRDKFTRGS